MLLMFRNIFKECTITGRGSCVWFSSIMQLLSDVFQKASLPSQRLCFAKYSQMSPSLTKSGVSCLSCSIKGNTRSLSESQGTIQNLKHKSAKVKVGLFPHLPHQHKFLARWLQHILPNNCDNGRPTSVYQANTTTPPSQLSTFNTSMLFTFIK